MSQNNTNNQNTLNCHYCNFCNKNIPKYKNLPENLNLKLSYFACDKCIESNTFYTTYFIKSNFILEDKYLQEAKFLVNFNKDNNKNNNKNNNNIEKLFLEKDILDLIKKQHKLREKKKEKTKGKEIEINNRRNLIKKEFEGLQLKYSETKDIYNFIHYGKPELNSILIKHMEEYNNLNETRYEFIKMLQKKNIKFNEKMLSYQKYLENNFNNIEDIIDLAEIENKLINKTNYLSYLENLDDLNNNQEEIFNYSLNELKNEDLDNLNSNQKYLINKEFYLE